MPRRSEDDREAVDRAFADLISGWDRSAGAAEGYEPPAEPEPEPDADPPATEVAGSMTNPPDTSWADQHPLFRYIEPEPLPQPEELDASDDAEVLEPFEPPPAPPLPRPKWPTLLAWIGLGYAVLAVLATVVGLRLPIWAGWLAVVGFVGGFATLVIRMPRTRRPDDGDGAVL